MTGTEIAIQVRGLSKEFANRSVLRQVELDVAAGQSLGLTGANGAGKTTLLRCLASVVRPTTGEVHWFGQRATADPAQRRLIGMVAHEHRLYPQLTLRENLVFAARMCSVAEPGRQADQWLDRVGLSRSADDLPGQVSKGMRQRVSLARALVHNPRILLLDEPFSGLDRQGTQWLMELLLDLRAAGRTICFASHDDGQTQRLADQTLELRSGRLVEREFGGELVTADVWARAA
jgi:heme exporter protein A